MTCLGGNAGGASTAPPNSQPKFDAESWLRRMPVMLHGINLEGRLVFVSDLWLSTLGYTREEVIGSNIMDLMPEEPRNFLRNEGMRGFLQTGHVVRPEYQIFSKDGRVVDVSIAVMLDRDIDIGNAVFITVLTDVTQRKKIERALADSEARYKALIENQSDIVSLVTLDGEMRFVNSAYARFFGLLPEEIIGRSMFDFRPPEIKEAVLRQLQCVATSPEPVLHEAPVELSNGEVRWVSWANQAIIGPNGSVEMIQSVGRDITDRVMMERQVKESEARYRLLAENSANMVFQLGLDLRFQYVSFAARAIFGLEPAQLVGRKLTQAIAIEDSRRVEAALHALITEATESQALVVRMRHTDGRWIWADTYFRVLKDPRTGVMIGITGSVSDISARKRVEEQLADANRRLEALASQDALTGLGNRRAFDGALTRELRHAKREHTHLSLLMIDVDRFKSFNDRYGHPLGDEGLRRIAAVMAATVRRPGDFAARYGGEEFVVLLPHTDPAGAAQIAEDIRRQVQALGIENAGSDFGVVTISIGVSAVDDHNDKGETFLLQSADDALYAAKHAGRNQVVLAEHLKPSGGSGAQPGPDGR